MKRDKFLVRRDMLQVIFANKQGLRLTILLTKANLSLEVARDHLKFMESNELVSKKDNLIHLTEKGRIYLIKLVSLLNERDSIIKEMDRC
jgi:predicted transcriptional regulator